jgi:hypothetical protein
MKGFLTHSMLYQILIEAEGRVKHFTGALSAQARANSAETVALCKERMRREGLTRAQLRKLAKESAC